jgi:hypothetical protein
VLQLYSFDSGYSLVVLEKGGRRYKRGTDITILLYEMVNYGTKWLLCKIHMVRNVFWLWYEIAILWYEMVNRNYSAILATLQITSYALGI